MVMKKNKIMALAMLCSTFLSPVSKAHGGTKQGTEKSDTQSDSDKNSQDIKNKKSDNPKEMYESRWKTDDIVKYIKYFFGTVIGGGGLLYAVKKGYEYLRNSKANEEDLIELEVKRIEPKINLKNNLKNLNINGKPKEVELSKQLVAKKIKNGLADLDGQSENSLRARKIYWKVVEAYESQDHDEFKKVIETKISEEKQDEEQFIALFRELDERALNIVLEGLTNEEQKFAKDNFKFYSFVWVVDASNIVIAFAPKEKEINLEGAKGGKAENFDIGFYGFDLQCYGDILKYCKIDKK